MLDELERRASGRGTEHVMLEVRADNTAATGLYRSAGYTVLTTRRGYYQPDGVDALVMRKTLVQNGVGDG
ncbi:GNAT family N-acetyltransferase [Phycicoccus sp. HDW14]|uniref:GNAT family N-acetyltransferase n=1 Tax=Phycicoccus sp. HDW14 TaxID=2714941 RepID=UPI0035300346